MDRAHRRAVNPRPEGRASDPNTRHTAAQQHRQQSPDETASTQVHTAVLLFLAARVQPAVPPFWLRPLNAAAGNTSHHDSHTHDAATCE